MYVKTTDVTVSAQGYEYPQAYTKRTLAPGVGSENFKWTDFVKPRTSAELNAQIAELMQRQRPVETKVESAEPLGVIKMWAGKASPTNYMFCDGSILKAEEYPELYEAIGDTFNTCNNKTVARLVRVQSGSFCLPDLRGRFIVGRDIKTIRTIVPNIPNIMIPITLNAAIPAVKKKHILTIEEMPKHSHNYTIYAKGSKDRQRLSGKRNNDSDTDDVRQTTEIGNNKAHENRPPTTC